MVDKSNERVEILWRVLILIVSGIILKFWFYFILVLSLVHWIMVLFTGRRERSLSDFCELWNSESYRFVRYITMQTNERPFPFTHLKTLGKFEK